MLHLGSVHRYLCHRAGLSINSGVSVAVYETMPWVCKHTWPLNLILILILRNCAVKRYDTVKSIVQIKHSKLKLGEHSSEEVAVVGHGYLWRATGEETFFRVCVLVLMDQNRLCLRQG